MSELNVLGCVPPLLNILFELAEESVGIQNFNIIKNIPVEDTDHFTPLANWNVNYFSEEKMFNSVPNMKYALSVVGTDAKEHVYNYFKDKFAYKDEQFLNLAHPSSYVSRSAELNHGLQLEPLCTIAAKATIGFCVNIKRNCNIGHHCNIGDFATINPGVTMSSFVTVGKKTMIGSGATIKDCITIGENTVIGAGSVVVKDIPSNSIAFGNPCVVHRSK